MLVEDSFLHDVKITRSADKQDMDILVFINGSVAKLINTSGKNNVILLHIGYDFCAGPF